MMASIVRRMIRVVYLIFFLSMSANSSGIMDFLQCRLCETVKLEGRISDCNCEYTAANHAVSHVFGPLLSNLTSSAFFRYFRVDLERPCPFWQEEGSCIMEGCSVCTCDESEEGFPRTWLDEANLIPTETTTTVHATHKTEYFTKEAGEIKIDDSDIAKGETFVSSSPGHYGWISTPSSVYGFEPGTGTSHPQSPPSLFATFTPTFTSSFEGSICLSQLIKRIQ